MSPDQEKLKAAILALPDRQRGAFLLRRYDGASYTCIALALGCTDQEAREAFIDAMTALQNLPSLP